jgi:hypothetical protein
MRETRDVAFAASKAFIWDAARIELPDGNSSLAMSFYPAESAGQAAWGRATEYLQDAGKFLFWITAHEIGHCWFPMMVGFNERRDPNRQRPMVRLHDPGLDPRANPATSGRTDEKCHRCIISTKVRACCSVPTASGPMPSRLRRCHPKNAS